MRVLRLLGNTIRRRFVAVVLGGCCIASWKDLVEWDDDCTWKEVDVCDGDLWENQENWWNHCIWPVTGPPEPPEPPSNTSLWVEAELWEETIAWENSKVWDESETWDEPETWSS